MLSIKEQFKDFYPGLSISKVMKVEVASFVQAAG
jgi:hypothetical protein